MTYTEVPGIRVPIRMWTDPATVEGQALQQLRNISSLPWLHGLAVMPDVHLGKGATVGSVIAMKGAVCPAAVGVDIGCGMSAVKTSSPPRTSPTTSPASAPRSSRPSRSAAASTPTPSTPPSCTASGRRAGTTSGIASTAWPGRSSGAASGRCSRWGRSVEEITTLNYVSMIRKVFG